MPINTLGANYESSCFKVNPVVSRLGPQTTTVKSGHVLPMISERKQSQKFSDTDLAKVAMQDTQHHQQKHPSSSASILPSSVDGSSKEWHVSLDSGKSRNSGGNTTERVPVASSEHVAEIVGRQGSKIKALRAKTNTYIKTPVRGEEPVFVVTGRADDVIAAKMEILSVAEHFDHVMALNKARPLPAPPSDSDGDGNSCQDSTANHVTVRVRVPYRVVGLLVGPKGATIKRIQLDSQTYIVTPSRDKEPIFEITGTPENVERAKAEIEGYIALRTGIADLASLQHQPTAVSPHQQQQQQQQQQHLSKFLLPPLNYNDFSTLLNGHGSASSGAFSALQLLSSLNGLSSAPNDICGAGGINSVGQTSNPQLINSAAAAVLGVYSQPAFKSSGQGKGVLWSDVKTEPKAWPSTLTEVIGSGLPSWFANSNSVTNQCTRHFAESGVRKMSLGSCRETPVCAPCKSYHDDLFDMSVLNPSGVFGSDAPMLNGSVSIADLCSYDRLNAFGAVGICNSNNNDNHLIKNSNYLNTLLNSSAINSNTSGNKNLASLDQRLLTTILSLKHSGSSLSTTSNVLQPQQPFGCCDFAISDFNNNINGCGCGFGCACSICSGGSLEYPRNSLLLTSMMMGSPNSCEGRDSKYKDDRTSEASFHNSNSALPGLNLFSGHFFSDSSGKQNQSPYTSLQRDGDTGLPFLSDRTQDEVLRFGGIMESTIMAFSDISSNSNSSSSSSPTDVTERTAY